MNRGCFDFVCCACSVPTGQDCGRVGYRVGSRTVPEVVVSSIPVNGIASRPAIDDVVDIVAATTAIDDQRLQIVGVNRQWITRIVNLHRGIAICQNRTFPDPSSVIWATEPDVKVIASRWRH